MNGSLIAIIVILVLCLVLAGIIYYTYCRIREKLRDTSRMLFGTVVLPHAQVKIYLTASSMVRAKRRYDELTAKGESCNLEKIRQDIEDRDYRDMHRETSPLKQAEDAVLVDTSDMTIEQVIDRIVELIG